MPGSERPHDALVGGRFARTAALYRYARVFLRYARWRAAQAFLLSLSAGVTEGVGLLVLIPFLYVVGLAPEGGGGSALADFATSAFTNLGLPLTLPSVLGVFMALIMLRALLTRARDVFVTEIRYGFADHLRQRLYLAIGRASWPFLARTRSSDFTHALTTNIGWVVVGTEALLKLAVVSLLTGVQAFIAFGLSPIGTTAAALSAGLLLVLLRPQHGRAHRIGQALTDSGRSLFGNVTEFLTGIKLAKSYMAEDRHAALFEQSATDMREQIMAFHRTNATARAIYQIGGGVALASLLYLAIEAIAMPISELLVLIVVFSRLLPSVMGMQQSYQQAVHMLPAFEALLAMQADCEAAREEYPAAADAAKRVPLHQGIRLRKVRFRYDKDAGPDVLSDVDLYVPAQQTTALVGSSGSGKSTVADLLLGLLEPDAGAIEVDDVPLTRERQRLWRANIAYVPQETFLFHDSVRANLLWARPQATNDDLRRVLHAAAAGFVERLPQGLDTVIGERGIRLSGGERQRLALARALLREPALLVLDEATSALDSENERRVQAAVENLHGHLTIVVIAHRLSTVRSADQIAVLEDGRVIETGNWQDLVSIPGSRFNALRSAAEEAASAAPASDPSLALTS